jgi:hypothetical protein
MAPRTYAARRIEPLVSVDFISGRSTVYFIVINRGINVLGSTTASIWHEMTTT